MFEQRKKMQSCGIFLNLLIAKPCAIANRQGKIFRCPALGVKQKTKACFSLSFIHVKQGPEKIWQQKQCYT
jgi:hypothetical protein